MEGGDFRMSQTIDERIVAMHFDNSDFEKKAKQTISTLDELRESLDLEGAAESLDKIFGVTSDQTGIRETAKQTSAFSKTLSSLGKVGKTAFKTLTTPVRWVGSEIAKLGNTAKKIFGIDMAYQLEQAGIRMVRAFTIDPIISGWKEYNLLIDSTKTILTGTVKSYTDSMKKANADYVYNEAEHLAYVNEQLDILNKYADDTVYSFQDMTSNIGKFTNVGVELEQATRSMKGIANATAYAGQGAQQASSAMYNLSQAMGTGYLGTKDWLSLENANIAGVAFKDTLIEMGVAMKTLRREGDKVMTSMGDGSEIEVTIDNIRDTLNKKWITKDVMLAAFDIFSGEYSADELAKKYEAVISHEAIMRLAEYGDTALKAAREVRTFSKMADALKESAQSGLAESWEIVTGDLNEATELWTSISEHLDGILTVWKNGMIGVLQGWKDLGGRDILIDTFWNLLSSIEAIGGQIASAWSHVFGQLESQGLVDATQWLRDLAGAFQ
jgi:tape measure domain-containing protein